MKTSLIAISTIIILITITYARASFVNSGGTISVLGDIGNVTEDTLTDDDCLIVQADGTWKNEACPGAAGGETNTASNLGAGVGVYETKSVADLQFNSLVSANAILTIAEDDANDEIDFTVDETAIDHDNLTGFVANEHLLPAAIDHDSLLNFASGEHFTMLDEDNLASDSDTQAATQQSIKAYVDALTLAGITQTGFIEEISGHVETADDKDYTLVQKAQYARQVTSIAILCTSGAASAALEIDSTDITTCTGLAVTTGEQEVTCDTGATNDLGAGETLDLEISNNSSCTDLKFTVKTTRD